MATLARVTGNPADTPLGHGRISVPDNYFEAVTSANSLDDNYTWYWPALLYMAIGLDRSIFAMFQDGLKKSFTVKTHQSSEPIVGFAGADKATNPWSGIVQGIPTEHASNFDGYVASYKFVRPGKIWRVNPTPTRVADPLVKLRRVGAWCTLLLPELPELGRKVVVTEQAGLMLRRPMVAIHAD
jgi:hypothetical protein